MNSILLTHDSTNNKIRPLESDTNGKLHISDSVAQSSLASIATNTNGNGSVLSDMLLDSNAMKTSLQLLDNAISGNQVQVDGRCKKRSRYGFPFPGRGKINSELPIKFFPTYMKQ
jgi:hypothetical protein